MSQGRKAAARKVVYDAFDSLVSKVPGQDPLEVFSTAIGNVKPMVEVRSRRVGGATLQVPHEIKRDRQQALAIRWIIQAARKKKGKPMSRRLAEELFDAFNRQGVAYTTRENTHKMAEANKAYAHFRMVGAGRPMTPAVSRSRG
jgi:small subunit ribosomal protein S7